MNEDKSETLSSKGSDYCIEDESDLLDGITFEEATSDIGGDDSSNHESNQWRINSFNDTNDFREPNPSKDSGIQSSSGGCKIMIEKRILEFAESRIACMDREYNDNNYHDCGDDNDNCHNNLDDGTSSELTTKASVSEYRSQQETEKRRQQAEATAPMLRSRVHIVKQRKQALVDSPSMYTGAQNSTLGAAVDDDDSKVSPLHRFSRPDRIDKTNQSHKLDTNNNSNIDLNINNSSLTEYRDSSCSLSAKQSNNNINDNIATQHRCSEFGSPPIFWVNNLIKNLFGSQLESINLASSDTSDKYSFIGSKSSASKLHEWQDQKQNSGEEASAKGNYQRDQGPVTDSIDMPNQSGSNNYGTSSSHRYQSFSNVEQENRRRRMSSSRRFRDLNGYSKLGQNYYEKSSQQSSIIQEFKRFLLLLIIVTICGVILWQLYELLVDEETDYLGVVKSPSELGTFYNYAVSTDAWPCASVGKQLLAKGGHAVDAAIGTLLCMGVSLPNSLGLGGGCLMTIYNNVTKQAIIVDGREIAPDYAHESMFSSTNPLAASRGPLSVGVPGELSAYWEAHQLYGRLKWSELFDHSIRMAEEGTPTVEHLSQALRDIEHAKYITEPLRKILWNNKTGDYVSEGEIFKQPALAETLKRIRDNGVNEFYKGQTGFAFIEDLQKQGGKLTMDNLSKYKALVKNATVIDLNPNLKVYTQPVPGSGIVLSIILRILRELGYFNNDKPKKSFDAAAVFYHHLIESFKFAYAQRGALEDRPDDPERMEKLLSKLDSDEFIKQAAAKIKSDKTLPIEEYDGLKYFQEDHGTAHVSVVDLEGNSVAVTTSLNLYFGSGLVSPSTGIIYNDVMDDFVSPNITNKFNLLPSKFNMILPGRRPLSSMSPSVFVDGKGNPKLVIGASGGSKITTAVATVSLRNQFFNEDIKTSIDGPRVHHQFLPEKVWFEGKFPPELLVSLENRGHSLQRITGRSSVVMAIACEYSNNGTRKILTANSDYRKGGAVAGL